MEYAVRTLKDFNDKTFYRIVERKSANDPWMIYLPNVDYDHEADAVHKLHKLQKGE